MSGPSPEQTDTSTLDETITPGESLTPKQMEQLEQVMHNALSPLIDKAFDPYKDLAVRVQRLETAVLSIAKAYENIATALTTSLQHQLETIEPENIGLFVMLPKIDGTYLITRYLTPNDTNHFTPVYPNEIIMRLATNGFATPVYLWVDRPPPRWKLVVATDNPQDHQFDAEAVRHACRLKRDYKEFQSTLL